MPGGGGSGRVHAARDARGAGPPVGRPHTPEGAPRARARAPACRRLPRVTTCRLAWRRAPSAERAERRARRAQSAPSAERAQRSCSGAPDPCPWSARSCRPSGATRVMAALLAAIVAAPRARSCGAAATRKLTAASSSASTRPPHCPSPVAPRPTQASARYMASSAHVNASVRLSLISGPGAADALEFEARRAPAPPPQASAAGGGWPLRHAAGAPHLVGRGGAEAAAGVVEAAGDGETEVAVSRVSLSNTLLASAIEHRNARFVRDVSRYVQVGWGVWGYTLTHPLGCRPAALLWITHHAPQQRRRASSQPLSPASTPPPPPYPAPAAAAVLPGARQGRAWRAGGAGGVLCGGAPLSRDHRGPPGRAGLRHGPPLQGREREGIAAGARMRARQGGQPRGGCRAGGLEGADRVGRARRRGAAAHRRARASGPRRGWCNGGSVDGTWALCARGPPGPGS